MRLTTEPSLDPTTYTFVHRLRVRFAETDAMGIVHHSRYVPYLEEARVEYLRAIGRPYTAWREAGTEMISASQGATSVALVGSIVIPSPIIPEANTSSGARSSASHQPSNGASRTSGAVTGASLRHLDPVECPHRVEAGSREPEAQVVGPRARG